MHTHQEVSLPSAPTGQEGVVCIGKKRESARGISPKERTSAQVKSLPKSRNARVAVGGCCCACRFTCSALANLELLHLWFGISSKY